MKVKTGKPGQKSKHQKKDIIAKVIDMRLVDMASTKTIIDYLMNVVGMSKTHSYDYLRWAREEIREQFEMLNPFKIEEAIGQYEHALESARMKKDWRLWADLRKELNKILGVYSAEKVDHTTNGKDLPPTQVTVTIVKKTLD
jgi:predicted metal-dependent phosphoesterase TrpH